MTDAVESEVSDSPPAEDAEAESATRQAAGSAATVLATEPKGGPLAGEPSVPLAAEPASEETPEPPLLGGRYRLIRRLGKGGMGEVFLAQHATIEKHVAIKILLAERAEQQTQKDRFLREARATAKIRHTNVIDISDFGETADGRTFFVMEFLQGEDLKKFCRRRHIVPWKEIELIVLQICSGLGAAHKAGIIHRDLKPDNIFLIEHHGITNFVKLLDFGLAKLVDDSNAKKLTKTGIIVGTPAFLSPEQIKGDQTDHRADIYAVGLVMYRMLCGALPFKAKSVVEMLRKQLMEKPLGPSVIAPDAPIPPAAERIVLKALEKDPEKRFQSTQELGQAIADVKHAPGGLQIAVPAASRSRELEIIPASPDAKTIVPLVSGDHTGPQPSAERDRLGESGVSGPQAVFEVVDPSEDDGVVTPDQAAQSFRSQLLSRPEEVDAQLRRQHAAEPRSGITGLIIVLAVVVALVIVAFLVLR